LGDIYVENVKPQHIDRIFSTHAWQQSTRNVKISAFKGFFKWCKARHYIGHSNDVMFGWRMRSAPEKERTRIPVDEWVNLFGNCVHPQERIIFATGLYLFLRSSEQRLIKLKDVNLDEGTIEIYRVKTETRDTMPISAELDRELRIYLAWYASQHKLEPDFYLIPARNRDLEYDPVNRRNVAGSGTVCPTRPISMPHRIVQRVLSRAGYETYGQGEHTLRRSGARAYFNVLVDSGYDGALRRVQSMLGHKKSMMTEVYLGLDLDRHTRNEDIIGNEMFPGIQTTNVVPIRGVS